VGIFKKGGGGGGGGTKLDAFAKSFNKFIRIVQGVLFATQLRTMALLA